MKHECETCKKSKHFKAGDTIDINGNKYTVEFNGSRCVPHGRAYTYDCNLWVRKEGIK